ncbi:MAG: DUF5916 domain-containing protein [bacterium]
MKHERVLPEASMRELKSVWRTPATSAICALQHLLFLFFGALPALAAEPHLGPPITIRRAAGPIEVDGDLSDPGWQGCDGITTWYETNVGDNVPPQVGNLAYLTYDDQYLYAGFVFEDPNPKAIRAPLGDHDAVGSPTDYGGVIVDSRNDGKTAQMFLANPRGVQYDALTSDVSGEDNSPDFFWESAGKITATGWNLEMRIPFTSLRYDHEATPTWAILLYRNYPRDRRYQFFSTRLPRDVNCFICNSPKLVGLESLPHGSHLVLAPFTSASQSSAPQGDLGSPLEAGDAKGAMGADLKWSPSAAMAIDGTWKPDFSQIESDAAQIVANERFALFFAEKRPFFLEGVDLFSTPLQAVYTRTITSPRGGVRATGRAGSLSYTALVAQDRGGGIVVLPGPQESDQADQNFTSDVAVTRVRRDFGRSFASVLATTREIHGGGYNRVFGPDFQWAPRTNDTFKGQFLWSETRTPEREDLASVWDGRRLSDGAGLFAWAHGAEHLDVYLQGMKVGEDFRADDGFIPQVGYREGYSEVGYTIRPKASFVSRERFFAINYCDQDLSGNVLNQRVSAGTGLDGRWNSFVRLELNDDAQRVGDLMLRRFRPRLQIQAVPGSFLNYVALDTYFGDEIDFDNAREGKGATVLTTVQLRPGPHCELRGDVSRRWLNVDTGTASGRLFTAQVERLRATWAFSARSFVRVIGQLVETDRNPALYTSEVASKDESWSGSALLAYKLNWQTVFYAGYGDEHVFDDITDRLQPSSRDIFAKLSYAWQH